MDSFKTVSVRSSVEILDFLGDIGGFQGAIEMIFGFFGTWFSSKFILAAIAKDLFKQKRITDGSGLLDRLPTF